MPVVEASTDSIVIVDANCFKHFEDPVLADRVERSLRAADLEIWPTALNALELVKTKNPEVRKRLLTAAARFLKGRPLLPLPEDVIREMGKAVGTGRNSFEFGASGLEWMLEHPDDVTPEQVETIEAGLRHNNDRLMDAFAKGRPGIQATMKKTGIRGEWSSAQDFLDRYWSHRDQLGSLMESEWTRLGLEGAAPIDVLLENEVWMLHFEGFGAALFGRVVAHEQTKNVQLNDIDQLIYLATWRGRVFVTEDAPCAAVAHSVLDGRYRGSRVLSWTEFLPLHDRLLSGRGHR